MIKILQSSAKLNCNGKIYSQFGYISSIIIGGRWDNRVNNITSYRLMCDSVKNRALEIRPKLKNQFQKPKSEPYPKLMKCPNPALKIAENKQKELHKKDIGGKNANVLQARDCRKPLPCPEKNEVPPGNQFFSPRNILLGLLAAGAGGGLLYYLLNNQEQKQLKVEVPSASTIDVPIPASSADIPKYVPYLLIGGGAASFSAFRAIKSHDPTAKVMVISNEFHKPYMRPPLSKELWYNAEKNKGPDEDFRFKQWNGSSRSLFFEPKEFYVDPTKLMETVNGGVSVCQGYTVKKILPLEQKVVLSDGTEIKYDKCLIATGCTPKTLDVISSASQNVKDKVSVFRNPEHFLCLKAIADTVQSITIIGSGFLGSELACALSKYGKDRNLKIYQVFHENGNMAKVLPEYLSSWTTKSVENQGVNVIPAVQITSIERIHDKLKLILSNGKTILTEHVVVCAGCEANTDIAKLSGLEIDDKLGGFLVNAELEARKNLFVAGDAACFYDTLLGRRRVEHHDHSVVSGRLAGENMTGLRNPYKHQSMFWSDLGPKLGYEGIGLIDSSLPTVGVFAKLDSSNVVDERGVSPVENNIKNVSFQSDDKSNENENSIIDSSSSIRDSDDSKTDLTRVKTKQPQVPDEDYGRGVIFYLKDNKVVGILLWNIFNRIGLARQIINENKTYDDLNEVAKLFEIHS